MCVIVDSCAFSAVFNAKNKDHKRFLPIKSWILLGKGKMIYGGKKYNEELSGSFYLGILKELRTARKLVKVDDDKVDSLCLKLKKKRPQSGFNDEHLVAIAIVSRCCVICTAEKKAIPHLQDKDLYPADMKLPKIYRSTRNKALCCDKHIVPVCR
jgi:hypothetical protein